MKTLLNLKSFFAVLIIALFAGCAGITEANLSDEATLQGADAPVIHQEVPDLFNSGNQEDIIEVRPRDSYQDRD